MTFIFKTTTTMKEYNARDWWIDRDYVGELRITAPDLNGALEKYREHADGSGVGISKSALKNRRRMYRDGDGQIGFVITGKTAFSNDRGGWSEQYVDLWIEVLSINHPFKKTA